eukprot:6167397-Amphidinium_carterae.2
MAREKSTVPPPKDRRVEGTGQDVQQKDCPPPPPTMKAAPKMKEVKHFSSLKDSRQTSGSKKEAESEPSSVKKKNAQNSQIYACPMCPLKFDSLQLRYIHAGMEHLVRIPMIKGTSQNATNPKDLHLI